MWSASSYRTGLLCKHHQPPTPPTHPLPIRFPRALKIRSGKDLSGGGTEFEDEKYGNAAGFCRKASTRRQTRLHKYGGGTPAVGGGGGRKPDPQRQSQLLHFSCVLRVLWLPEVQIKLVSDRVAVVVLQGSRINLVDRFRSQRSCDRPR